MQIYSVASLIDELSIRLNGRPIRKRLDSWTPCS